MDTITIRPNGQLKRRGLPNITGPMRVVLIQLRDAQQQDTPFLSLTDADPRTIHALEERDWIVSTPSHQGQAYYRITGRGLHALEVYSPLVRRCDRLCPRCGLRPRPRTSSGRLAPYCKECKSRVARRQYLLGRAKLRPTGLCSRCKKRERFVASTGRVYCWCKHCKNVMHRRDHKRQRKALYKRILAGEHIPCARLGCTQPRYVTGVTVQDFCREHHYEYQKVRAQARNNKSSQ